MTANSDPSTPLCILHLEDSSLDYDLVQRELRRSGEAFTTERVDTLEDFARALENPQLNVVLADYRLAGFTALDAWALMCEKKIRLPFVLLSGAIGEAAAVRAIQRGMSDYLPKDELGQLRHVIARARQLQRIVLAKEQADAELRLSQARLASFTEHLQSTIEQERAAIAREIHDDIGGSLAAIRFDLSWLARHSREAARLSHIESASDMLQHALAASQRIMHNLRPAILDQGLIAALQWLVNSVSERTHLPIVLRAPEELRDLSKTKQLTAYRTAQEALTNIVKHAQATQVKVDLTDDGGVLTLEVTDNGKGLTPQDLDKTESFGIRGLHERAKSVGGWLDVSSVPAQATSVILSIPLSPRPLESAGVVAS